MAPIRPAAESSSRSVLVLVAVWAMVGACQRSPLRFQAGDGSSDGTLHPSDSDHDTSTSADWADRNAGDAPVGAPTAPNGADGRLQVDAGGAQDARPAMDHWVAPKSDCTVDDDCLPGRRCSPSQVNVLCFCPVAALCDDSAQCWIGSTPVPCVCGDACGHGYFCHTARDTCNDDSDCTEGTCNYDWVDESWSCSDCWPHTTVI